ncbi:hypothetical protein [Pseudoxanthomonas indica]|uniref:Lipoprotein n=1 Tax=Pseudoxanthomonas indica TaxID=428993 RepID=A0A1T5JWT8_9GAMM|nr:hypothetical protein [Pseudoxanthomonas indica]GGD44856.1 hypothetical protein GCM10007235_16000 [Pseudoxanthomonas indica]SKC55719.1 hypothetical protein SAMN06296058_1140 [Pseudoxanthomonas indica]
MKRLQSKFFIALITVLALAACKPAAESQTPVAEAPPATDAPAPAAADPAPPAAGEQQPIADTHGGAAEPTPQAQGETDDHTAVNQTISQVLGDAAPYEKAILAFQQAVAQKDAATVASMIDFPFKTHVDNRPATIADASEFIAKYGQIVSPQVAEAITRQRYSDLFVNQKGVMFGSGEAWLNGVCRDDKCEKVEVRVVALQPGQ